MNLLFVIALAMAGMIAFFVARRLLQGGSLAKSEWIVTMPRGAQTTSPTPPTVQDLAKRLASVGYKPELFEVDDLGNARGPMDARVPLIGTKFVIVDPRLGSGGAGLTIRFSQLSGDMKGAGLSFVEARDSSGDAYEEMAIFAIVELAELLPGSCTSGPTSPLARVG